MGSDDWGSEIKDLLKGENTWVSVAADAAGAVPAVQSGRDNGMVVVDTPPVSPRDAAAVHALATELQTLGLDALYIAVPATFSAHAAHKLLEAFEALGADGIAVTHVDEAEQLGIAAELSFTTGMPIAYVHDGLDLKTSLSATDTPSLAALLLP
jgi:flagellar biosynthesis GTPase FlhF